MGAVGVLAVTGERLDVPERLLHPVPGAHDRQGPHPGRVDQEPTSGQEDQLAVGGRVPSLAVAPHRTRRQDVLTGQQVHQRRLPRS